MTDVKLPPLPDQIKQMMVVGYSSHEFLTVIEQYARLAVLQERERCAKICEGVDNYANPMTSNDCADAIRKGE